MKSPESTTATTDLPKVEIADGDDASIGADEDTTEAGPDVDDEPEDTETVTESVDDTSGADWSISFDPQDDQALDGVEEESEEQAEEADVAVEASASS
jgi:hypothetical protein